MKTQLTNEQIVRSGLTDDNNSLMDELFTVHQKLTDMDQYNNRKRISKPIYAPYL